MAITDPFFSFFGRQDGRTMTVIFVHDCLTLRQYVFLDIVVVFAAVAVYVNCK